MNLLTEARPTTLKDFVFGSAREKQLVEGIVKAGNTGHILLHGPYGTGKTTLARLLPDAITPGIDEGGDIKKLDGSMQTSIEGIRGLKDFCNKIALGVRRYVLIDECDGLSPEAQKSLKGLLDDVADIATFIFCTNHIDKVDPGIQSRCHVIRIGPPDPERWAARANHILRAHGYEADVDKLRRALAKQRRDIRAYLRMLEECLASVEA